MSLSTQLVHATAKQMVHTARSAMNCTKMKKFLTKVGNLCRPCPRCCCLSSVLYPYWNHSYKKQWRNFRNQDFQTNLAHLIILDRKMIPSDPHTSTETQGVHRFIYNVPQLPSLSSNAGGRWQKIVTCNNNLSQQPTTPIHSQKNLSTVHIHHVSPHWGRHCGLPVGVDSITLNTCRKTFEATFWAN